MAKKLKKSVEYFFLICENAIIEIGEVFEKNIAKRFWNYGTAIKQNGQFVHCREIFQEQSRSNWSISLIFSSENAKDSLKT